MSYRVEAFAPPSVTRRREREQRPARDRTSAGAHLLGMGVVLLLFGSLLGPLNQPVLLGLAAAIVCGGIIRALALHGAIAGRTLFMVLVIAGVVGLRGIYDPPIGEYGHTKWVNFSTLAAVTMAAAAAVIHRRSVRAVAVWWVVAGVALAGFAFLDPGAATGRAQVDGSNPVWLGRAIAASLVVVVWLGVSRTWRWWRVALLVPILGAGLLATGSRGPALAAVVGVVVLLIAPTARRSSQILWLAFGGVLALFIAPMIPAVADSRFGQFIAQGDVGDESRNTLLSASIHAIPEYPLGAGLGQWSQATGITRHQWPHNLFLEVFVEQGWLVGAALVLLVTTVAYRAWRRSGGDPALQLAIALLATETIHVSTSGDLNARTFFFVLLLTVALLCKQSFEPTEPTEPVEATERQPVPDIGVSKTPARGRR